MENKLCCFLKKSEIKKKVKRSHNVILISQEYSTNPIHQGKPVFLIKAVIYKTMERIEADLPGSYIFIHLEKSA